MDQEKLLQQVLEYNGTPQMVLIKAWIQEEIEKLRVSNDNAVGDEVLRNQGAISKLKQMLRWLEPNERLMKLKKNPPMDGAYA